MAKPEAQWSLDNRMRRQLVYVFAMLGGAFLFIAIPFDSGFRLFFLLLGLAALAASRAIATRVRLEMGKSDPRIGAIEQ